MSRLKEGEKLRSGGSYLEQIDSQIVKGLVLLSILILKDKPLLQRPCFPLGKEGAIIGHLADAGPDLVIGCTQQAEKKSQKNEGRMNNTDQKNDETKILL